MLANGIKLFFKRKGDSGYSELEGLKEVPEMGEEPEKVENTCLSDTVKQYEFGIGDPGDLEFKFKYDNSSATSSYRVMRLAQASKEILTFMEQYPDGTTFTFDAMVSVKLGGGAVNGVLDWSLKMALQSDIEIDDPPSP